MLFHKKIQSQFRYCRAFFVERHDEMKLPAKSVFFCVAARLYEGASYQLFEKMSKYTVSVKSILNVTKVRCTSTYQTRAKFVFFALLLEYMKDPAINYLKKCLNILCR